jgi:hypothetical protein
MLKYNHRVTEVSAILAFSILNLIFLKEIILQFQSEQNNFNIFIPVFLMSIFFAYLLADFFSGLVHFLGDTFGTETTPIFGEPFIKPFREHHIDPKAMTLHNFVETSGNNCIVSLPPMFLIFFFLNPNQNYFTFFCYSSFTFLMLFIFMTNEIHKWAHMDNPNGFIRILQYYNIILSPTHHKIHHTEPYDKYFCITSGILNPFLYKIRFFELVKKVFKK